MSHLPPEQGNEEGKMYRLTESNRESASEIKKKRHPDSEQEGNEGEIKCTHIEWLLRNLFLE